MFNRKLVAVPCKISPGMFSGERVFAVELANGTTYRGIAPRQFCWNAEGRLVAENEPSQEIEGKVAAKLIDELEESQVAVEVPDGEVIAVDASRVGQRPTDIRPPSAVRHGEC
jgi:hypothetical protein